MLKRKQGREPNLEKRKAVVEDLKVVPKLTYEQIAAKNDCSRAYVGIVYREEMEKQ